MRLHKKFPKNAKKSPLGHTFGGKMLLPGGATNFFPPETNSICMDFICLQWLAAGILSVRNNGAFRCYVEFTVRTKTEFSYIYKKSTKIQKNII